MHHTAPKSQAPLSPLPMQPTSTLALPPIKTFRDITHAASSSYSCPSPILPAHCLPSCPAETHLTAQIPHHPHTSPPCTSPPFYANLRAQSSAITSLPSTLARTFCLLLLSCYFFPALHLSTLFSLPHHWAPIINDTWTEANVNLERRTNKEVGFSSRCELLVVHLLHSSRHNGYSWCLDSKSFPKLLNRL